jgi:hypothetical protein
MGQAVGSTLKARDVVKLNNNSIAAVPTSLLIYTSQDLPASRGSERQNQENREWSAKSKFSRGADGIPT